MVNEETDSAKIKIVCNEKFIIEVKSQTFAGAEFVKVSEDTSDSEIEEQLKNSDIVFIVNEANSSNAAEIARKLNILSIAIVNIEDIFSPLVDAFVMVAKDDKSIAPRIINAICDLTSITGFINLDYRDVQAMLKDVGAAFIGVGEASGDNAVVEAVNDALNSISEDIKNTERLLINVVGSSDFLTMMEVQNAVETLQSAVHPNAEIIWGVRTDDTLNDKVKVTIIAASVING